MPAVHLTPKIGTPGYWARIKGKIAEKHRAQEKNIRIAMMQTKVETDRKDDHKFTAQITKQIVDRDQEVVITNGIKLADYNASGAIHWAHDFDRPIGIGGNIKRMDDGLIAEGTFMRRPEKHTGEFFADYARAFVTQMVAAGKFPGVSIGFEALASRPATRKDKEDFNDDLRIVTTESNLLEWSIASVPANPLAFVTSTGGGELGKMALKALFKGFDIDKLIHPKSSKVYFVSPPKTYLVSPPIKVKVVKKKIKTGKYYDLIRKELEAKQDGTFWV